MVLRPDRRLMLAPAAADRDLGAGRGKQASLRHCQNSGSRVRFGDSAVAAVQLLVGERDGQDVKADDTVKVPEIGCPDAPSGRYRGRRDEAVVGADVLAGGGGPGAPRSRGARYAATRRP
jgi:hypothetical protein